MAVGVERCRRLSVAHHLLKLLDVGSCRDRDRSSGVPEVVDSNVLQPGPGAELLGVDHPEVAAFLGGAAYVTGHAVKVWGATPELGLLAGLGADPIDWRLP